MRTGALAFVLACVVAAGPASARQRAQSPYSTIDWSMSPVENVNRVGMHTWWRPSTGVAGRISVPWPAGFLEAGGRLLPLEARYTDVPSYDALLLWAGWGARWSPWRFIRISASLRAGLLRMSFEEDTQFAGVRTENELTVGPAARLEIFPVRPVGVFVEATGERTFTSVEIDWVHVSAGLVLRTGLPGWARRILE